MRVTRYGHSAVLVESVGQRILIDPDAFSMDETFGLTGLDVIVVTHEHADHFDRNRAGDLLASNPTALRLAPPTLAAELGWQPVTEHRLGAMLLSGVGTRHAEILPTLARVENSGVLIQAAGEPTFFHPGDSYETVPQGVDVLALPLVAPWTKISETVAFAQAVKPTAAFMIHDRGVSDLAYGIYAGHVQSHGGIHDLRLLGQTDTSEF